VAGKVVSWEYTQVKVVETIAGTFRDIGNDSGHRIVKENVGDNIAENEDVPLHAHGDQGRCQLVSPSELRVETALAVFADVVPYCDGAKA